MLFNDISVKKDDVNHFEDVFNEKKFKRTWIERLSKEWIFTFIIFLLLSLIVIEKIYFSYVLSIMSSNAHSSTSSNDGAYNKADVKISSLLYDFLKLSNIINLGKFVTQQLMIIGEQFTNTIYYYREVLYNALNTFDNNYLILIRAIIGGVSTTIISWLIIYMDSRIPGYDPPFPFHLIRKGNYRIQITAPINLNYFVGGLIGLLITIFILLENGYFNS